MEINISLAHFLYKEEHKDIDKAIELLNSKKSIWKMEEDTGEEIQYTNNLVNCTLTFYKESLSMTIDTPEEDYIIKDRATLISDLKLNIIEAINKAINNDTRRDSMCDLYGNINDKLESAFNRIKEHRIKLSESLEALEEESGMIGFWIDGLAGQWFYRPSTNEIWLDEDDYFDNVEIKKSHGESNE